MVAPSLKSNILGGGREASWEFRKKFENIFFEHFSKNILKNVEKINAIFSEKI
jgi:hypothetical protein